MKRSLCPRTAARARAKARYILNDVKQIQDYYAPLVGEFELLVLLSLLRLGGGAYGAAIRREIQEKTQRDVAIGTVYMTLKRLEDKGMICSYVGLPSAHRGGRRRRHYVMHELGQHALGRAYRTFQTMAEGFQEELAAL